MILHITRGGDTRGVVAYLVGKGRSEEHVEPHLVAGSAEAVLLAAGRLLERRDVGPLAGLPGVYEPSDQRARRDRHDGPGPGR